MANTVVRGEGREVTIGAMTNIQDFTMIHGGGVPIGASCSITHHCTIHAATVEDNCLIGINATVMDGAVIEANSIVAGGAFITEGTIVPPNSVVMGAPGKVRRTANNFVANRLNALNARIYYRNAFAYARGDYRAWTGSEYEAFVRGKRVELKMEYTVLFGAAVPRRKRSHGRRVYISVPLEEKGCGFRAPNFRAVSRQIYTRGRRASVSRPISDSCIHAPN